MKVRDTMQLKLFISSHSNVNDSPEPKWEKIYSFSREFPLKELILHIYDKKEGDKHV